MFLELFYKNYRDMCRDKYWEEPVSLPYSVIIRDREERATFEKMLRQDGFECVVGENGHCCMYVNFTLKRYGRNVKACGSASINSQPLSKAEFMEKVYLSWQKNTKARKEMENNFVLSAQISLRETERILERNICAGLADEDFIRWAEDEISRYKQYLRSIT